MVVTQWLCYGLNQAKSALPSCTLSHTLRREDQLHLLRQFVGMPDFENQSSIIFHLDELP